ncbi:MAG: gamma-glutamylcyclotransferase [Actinobacteria bacterium]|nr:MAG: gamma-glutamylcyclotransferase [Actinomycetota bacterium]
MTHYFAYGSNMDPKQMASRCPGAMAVGRARLADYELVFVWDSPGWGGGVATVVPSSGREVWGVLWDLTDEHVEGLDRYEGVAIGAYVREHLDVEAEAGLVNALIYLATDTRRKQPSGRYVDALIRGAQAFSLPESYVEMLRALRA